MGVFLSSIITEYYTGSAWADITAYVVGDIKGNNGLGGWKPDQRVAVLGTLNIILNNKGKLFSPMGGDAVRGLSTLAGFNKGSKIRIRGTFNGIPYTIWTGWIASIDSDDLNWGNEQARLMAVDYMQVPVNYPMKGATIALNKTIDEAMTLILARLSLQPSATDFMTGNFTFPAIFDNVQRKTMAMSEFTKLANSELGYIYTRHDGTLVAENMLAREGWRALDQVWIRPDTDSFLLLSNAGGGFLILSNAGGGKLILSEGTREDAAIHSDAESYNIFLGEDDLLNASIIRTHPTITDTSLKVLYTLGTPRYITAGDTVYFSAHYTDPSGLSQVSGTNMQAPVATTDYLANTLADGSGTNKTSDMVVTATYYGDVVEYSIANNSNANVYITFLQARGYGIYYGNSIESTKDDAASQAAYGYTPFQFDQKYQKDTYLADMYGLSVIEEYKYPKSRITKMKYLANLNKNHMVTFLTLSIGAMLLGTEDRSNISNHYYITDRAFTIKQGGIINVEYGVKQNDSYLSGGVNPITVEFDSPSPGTPNGDALNYGYLPQVSGDNVLQRSWSVWFYQNTDGPSSPHSYVLMSTFGDLAGCLVYSRTPKVIYFYSQRFSGGRWQSPDNSFTLNAWHQLVITMDESSIANDPIIYIDGTSVTVTESLSPSGVTVHSEVGRKLIIGNLLSNASVYSEPYDGKLFDARVYNRILTAAEVTELYNAGVPDHTLITDGIVFQGPAVYADQGDDASLAGTVLTSADRLVENALRAVGIPHGAPIIRANP